MLSALGSSAACAWPEYCCGSGILGGLRLGPNAAQPVTGRVRAVRRSVCAFMMVTLLAQASPAWCGFRWFLLEGSAVLRPGERGTRRHTAQADRPTSTPLPP